MSISLYDIKNHCALVKAELECGPTSAWLLPRVVELVAMIECLNPERFEVLPEKKAPPVRVFSCKTCGVKFEAKRKSAIFCSMECNRKRLSAPGYNESLVVKFRSLHAQGSPEECWNWNGTINGYGYGVMSAHGKYVMAHRYALELSGTNIPEGYLVCHRCDNRRCVNPGHLFVGSDFDNAKDRIRKGRGCGARGEASGKAILNEESVIEIRRLYAEGSATQSELGLRFGVSASAIANVVTRKNWSHVP